MRRKKKEDSEGVMEEKEFRNKITCFSFFFSILVIWAHSYNGELFLGKTHQGKTVLEAERFLGDVVGQMAVPGFFLLSAYLFYRNFHWRKLLCKWKSRAWSVRKGQRKKESGMR